MTSRRHLLLFERAIRLLESLGFFCWIWESAVTPCDGTCGRFVLFCSRSCPCVWFRRRAMHAITCIQAASRITVLVSIRGCGWSDCLLLLLLSSFASHFTSCSGLNPAITITAWHLSYCSSRSSFGHSTATGFRWWLNWLCLRIGCKSCRRMGSFVLTYFKSELKHRLLVVIDSHLAIVLVIFLVLEQSDPLLVRVEAAIQNDELRDRHTANIVS